MTKCPKRKIWLNMSLFFNLDYLKSYIWGPSAMRRRWARIYALWGSKSANLVPKKCSKSPQKAFKKRLKNKAWKKKIQNENCPFMTFEKKEGSHVYCINLDQEVNVYQRNTIQAHDTDLNTLKTSFNIVEAWFKNSDVCVG